MIIHPWDIQEGNSVIIAELRRSLAGDAVINVRYIVPKEERWPEGHRADRVHEVDMAVELQMESGSALILSWDMDGLNEGIAADFRGPGEEGANLPGDPIDVSDHIDWEEFLGVSIVSINAAWHVPNEGCPEMPWSYHFMFSDDSSVTIALGGDNGVGLRYIPDALVVILDKEMAATYKIPASSTPSCG
ncbi:hypothetical protein [Actinopolyspora mzabensis]|uniref:hypothetical protein n=1 Tax=Actinopolyspora mzabensis TaxID=995066 RepID=UPI001C409F1C|nr:hypothetical protein [Actinopolyspora mzabensis]